MSYRQQRTEASIADGFLDIRRNHKAAGIFNRVADRVISLYHRMAENHRRAVLHRKTMTAMAKLDDHMLSDVGWPGRYDPESTRETDDEERA